MTAPADVVAAEARVSEARRRLAGTVEQLQGQLAPRKLVRTAADGVAEQALSAFHTSVKTMMRHPSAITGGLAGIVLLLCRKPLARAFGVGKRAPSPAKPPHLTRVR